MVIAIAGVVAASLAIVVAGVLFRQTARSLMSRRLPSASLGDHMQAARQIDAMRGAGPSATVLWDGIDRLGSAGMDRGGGTL